MTKFKKFLLILIIIGLTIPFFYLVRVPESKALDGGAGWANFFQKQLFETVLKPLMRGIAQKLLNTYVNKMVEAINGSGRSPSTPAFVDIWRNFITEAQYRGEDAFRAILVNTNTCPYFAGNLRTIFKATSDRSVTPLIHNIRVNNLDPYTLRAQCTMPQGWSINNYQKDFSGNGGWEALVNLSQPQNNFYGSLLLSTSEVAAQRALEAQGDYGEVIGGRGFMATRSSCVSLPGQCIDQECFGGGNAGNPCQYDSQCPANFAQARCTFMGQTLTPASVIGNGAAKFIDGKIGFLLTSQDVVSVLLNSLGSIIDNLLTFRKVSKQDVKISGGKADKYQQCVNSCGGRGGDSYKACLEGCARQAGAELPCDYDLDNPSSCGPPPPPAACADGTDNDGDGNIDYAGGPGGEPADPGCTDSSDTDETDTPPPPPPTPIPPPPGIVAYTINVQDSENEFMAAEGGGGQPAGSVPPPVTSNRTGSPGAWETFRMWDLNGGSLTDGDQVAFVTADNAHFLRAEGGGGSTLDTSAVSQGVWETYTILKQNGTGTIANGDQVAFKTWNGTNYLSDRQDLPDDEVSASIDAIGPWETFILIIQ